MRREEGGRDEMEGEESEGGRERGGEGGWSGLIREIPVVEERQSHREEKCVGDWKLEGDQLSLYLPRTNIIRH